MSRMKYPELYQLNQGDTLNRWLPSDEDIQKYRAHVYMIASKKKRKFETHILRSQNRILITRVK